MKKLNKFLSILVVIALPMALFVKPVIAQDTLFEDSSVTYEEYEDFEFDTPDWMESFQEGFKDGFKQDESELSSDKSTAISAIAGLFTGSMVIFVIILCLAPYIYVAITLQKTAQRLGMENTWFAWIPILQMILLFKMGDQNPLLLLLVLIPFVGAFVVGIFTIIAIMNVCEKRGHDKLCGLIALTPLHALILWGVLAWEKDKKGVEEIK